MFHIVANEFAALRSLPDDRDRWLVQCLGRYADRGGKCWPTLRQLAVDALMSVATVCRRLKKLADLGVFHRERKGVGRYVYTLAESFRPRLPKSLKRPLKPQANPSVSPEMKHGVSQAATQEADPFKQAKESRAREPARGRRDGASTYDRGRWEPRLRGWLRSRFWLDAWGNRPGQPGCMAPIAIVEEVLRAASAQRDR